MKLYTKIIGIGTACLTLAASALAETATPAMWRAADRDTEVFMLGTFHILPKTTQWRTAEFEKILNEAEIIYFEVETDAPDAQSKTLGVLMTQGFNANGGLLSEMLEAEDVASLRNIVSSLGLPFQGVDPMRPWNAFLTLSVQFIVQQGFDPGSGVDSVLLAEARTKGKDIRFFETLEEQLALFTGLDAETEKALLLVTIREWTEQAERFDDLFQAWREGDTEAIDQEMNTVMRKDTPDVYDRLIVNRNKAWTDEISDVLKNETGVILVAVGAAHLVGDKSVPAMLQNRGVEVERINATSAPANENSEQTPDDNVEDGIAELLKGVGEN